MSSGVLRSGAAMSVVVTVGLLLAPSVAHADVSAGDVAAQPLVQVDRVRVSADGRTVSTTVHWNHPAHVAAGEHAERLAVRLVSVGKRPVVLYSNAHDHDGQASTQHVTIRLTARQGALLSRRDAALTVTEEYHTIARPTGRFAAAEVTVTHLPRTGSSTRARPANAGHRDCSAVTITQRADLHNCDLIGADLRGTDLTGADLSRDYALAADLSGADLTDADLSYADLSYADLSYANVTGADFRHANGTGAKTTQLDNPFPEGRDVPDGMDVIGQSQ